MQRARLKVDPLPACPDGIATVIAIPVDGGDVLIGEAANQADEESYLKLANWKMLLGKSAVELETEKTTNPELARALRKTTLEKVASSYFRVMLEQTLGNEPELREKPQTIIGVPPSASTDQLKWRQTYRRRIERIFTGLGYPKPRFWPEPFAVFQYHLNLVEIRDIGTRQNVFVVDIGGATTNVCLIQTTQHGRLARGGLNHVPHGVKSTEVGGVTLDACIADKLALAGPTGQVVRHVKAAKELLSTTQIDWSQSSLASEIEFEWNGEAIALSASLVKRAFVENVWPAIAATLDESLEEVDAKGLAVQEVHIVILAGGTCQMGLVQELLQEKLLRSPRFANARFLVSPDYRRAVAHGLAIEAAANSRHHEMMPSRVSAYLQEDLTFECGHNGNDLYRPPKLRSEYASQGDLRNGVLLKAPKEIGLMLNKPRTWDFRLKQNTRELFYRFSKLSGDESEVLLNSWQRISRSKARKAGRQLALTMTLQEDGFAKLAVDTTEDLSYELEPIDLHDLSDLVGDTFFAVDFGTDNTQIAYVNVKDPDLLEPLPSSYTADPRAERRARELVTRLELILGPETLRRTKIQQLNDEAITEYVYHSNRIEGSLLDRGDTQSVLDGSSGTEQQNADSIVERLDKLGIIDDQGQIVAAKMVV